MWLTELASLYKNGEIEKAIKEFKAGYCVRKPCPHEEDVPACSGCIKQLLLYESLYRHDPEIEEALAAFKDSVASGDACKNDPAGDAENIVD
ncbi:hypothetical protein [Paremcibacter congregatus]|uniref:hypothetical protein n=1 Tax=Paremcibacter congregatus TaxID=2043170 RepID=UPI003A8CD217